MRTRSVLWLSAVLVVGFVLLASPASAVNTCKTICNCTVSCATACIYGMLTGPPDFEFEIYAENCGEYGICVGSGSCPPDPSCPAQNCTTALYGTSGPDTLNGGSARECIYGYEGNDTIDGNAGDDRMWGHDGTDTIYGDSGNDCLYGGNQNDHLDGQSGYDLANGQGGSGDTCYAEIVLNCE